MKNMIIAAMAAYIFYGFCEIRQPLIPVAVFLIFWFLIGAVEAEVNDFRESVRRGERLNRRINYIRKE